LGSPLWVKKRRFAVGRPLPVYARKRTFSEHAVLAQVPSACEWLLNPTFR
jgi:hypothetical protein